MPKKTSKKKLTKGPSYSVNSLVRKTSEETFTGGWRKGRPFEPFRPVCWGGKPPSIRAKGQRKRSGKRGQRLQLLESVRSDDVLPTGASQVAARNQRWTGLL